MTEGRLKDVLLMALAIQLSIIGTAPANDSLLPLLLVGVAITVLVIAREVVRRVGEYSAR